MVTNTIGMKLVQIPLGEFLMGSPGSERGRYGTGYQHCVRITKPFYLGMYEVTQAEYELVVGMNPSDFSKGGRDADSVLGMDTSAFPVENVSWKDAVEFCRKISALPEERSAGRIYRLPTEAEWEYACRAGTTTTWSCGDDKARLGEYAWYGDRKGTPHSVGQKKPNAWGLYDMHGSVWEWCQDWYDYYKSSSVDDPLGPEVGLYRVYRGGCWFDLAWPCQSAFRFRGSPDFRFHYLGFRVACAIGEDL